MQRITARAAPGVRYWLISIGTVVALGAVHALIDRFVLAAVAHVLSPVVGVLGTGVFVFVVMRALNGRAVAVEVDGDAIVVNGTRYPLREAAVGVWRMPGLGTRAGTILALRSGASTLRVLGYWHVLGGAWREGLAATYSYDLRVTSEELQAILDRAEACGACAPRATASTATPEGTVRCELVANRGALSIAVNSMAPTGIAFALMLAAVALVQRTPVSGTRWGQYVEIAVALPIFLGGMAVTVLRWMRRPPALELEVSAIEITLREPSGPVRYTVPRASVQIGRFTQRVRTRFVDYDCPCVGIRVPGRPDLYVGLSDPSFVWSGPAERLGGARGYITGFHEWHALINALGLHGTRSPWP